ncbi:MAG TPA: class II aldolase/adducin family protein [Candidatus Acetothermia bacterium]|nr:class II aldolase/adducin family protein [Candidatus Acetothermia bacterium]
MNDTDLLRRRIAKVARAMADAGLARGSSGNVSVRFGDRILITASGIPYEDLKEAQILEINLDGNKHSGEGEPSSEWRMHAEIYRRREDVGAIVHTHSPYATAAAISLRTLPIVHDEGRILFGEGIPVSDHALPGTWELARAVADALGDRSAALIARHGAVAVGRTSEEALMRAEKIEETAQLFWLSRSLKEDHEGRG